MVLTPQNSQHNDNIIEQMVVRPNIYSEITLKLIDGKHFNVSKHILEIKPRWFKVNGSIKSSLYLSAIKAGVPNPVLMELIRIYSWDVDFQRGINNGDRFEVLFEKLFTEDGKFARYGKVLYGNLILQGKSNSLYRYKTTEGLIDYFDAKGQSARKALMRTPINGARLSSGFGKRRHPILGYTKFHRGIDFAAPRGTPIYAAGSGTVVNIGRNGAYGKYIRIRHGAGFETAYAHLSRFNRKKRRGTRVKQGEIIGFVGSTGRSTGPHLHFEILKNRRQINPLKLKLPSGKKLSGKELKLFHSFRVKLDQRFTMGDLGANFVRSTQ
jgi:murein DD-endopeptidase MepM/ murein hydrolase activator NlpD